MVSIQIQYLELYVRPVSHWVMQRAMLSPFKRTRQVDFDFLSPIAALLYTTPSTFRKLGIWIVEFYI